MTIEEFAKAHVGYMETIRGGSGAVVRYKILENNEVELGVWRVYHGIKTVTRKYKPRKYAKMTVEEFRKYKTDAEYKGFFITKLI